MSGLADGRGMDMRGGDRRRIARRLAPVLAMIALLLIAVALLRPASRSAHPRPARAPAAARLALPAAPPAIAPQIFVPLPADQAKRTNATIPFVPGAISAAAPFAYVGTPQDRANALACLAAAAYYEAGDDAAGEAAVAQVVLNRVRHPAFPKTVCGVVFQGAERTTGCQFTFACDGALARLPSAAAWQRARAIADSALTGHVDAAVGTATHYHADYVVPYWRASLDKLAQIGRQIFYRWPGWWGSRRAFTGRLQPFERIDPRLVALAGPAPDPAFTGSADDAAALFETRHPPVATLRVPGVPARALHGATVRLMDGDANQFVLQLAPSGGAAGHESAARALCGTRPDCIVMGWLRADRLPEHLPVPPPKMRTMAFLYRRSSILGTDRAYWNCHQVPGAPAGRCLPGTEP